MKDIKFVIDLEEVERDHQVEIILKGLATEHKYFKEIKRLILKLADRNLEAICSNQPLQISRQHGEFRIQDNKGHNLFGRARKLHKGTRHHSGKSDK